MRRIIPLALLALTLVGGSAFADRRDTSHRSGGTRVQPTQRHRVAPVRADRRANRVDRRIDRRADRFDRRADRFDRRADRFDRRADRRFDRRVTVQRTRPAFRNNRFYFSGGHYRTYRAPVINVRYRNYNRRPALLIENYDPVEGYVWIRGHWYWGGYEWLWAPGHYEVDASYTYYGY